MFCLHLLYVLNILTVNCRLLIEKSDLDVFYLRKNLKFVISIISANKRIGKQGFEYKYVNGIVCTCLRSCLVLVVMYKY